MRVVSKMLIVELTPEAVEANSYILDDYTALPDTGDGLTRYMLSPETWKLLKRVSPVMEQETLFGVNLIPHAVEPTGEYKNARCTKCYIGNAMSYHCWKTPCMSTNRLDGKEVYYTLAPHQK